MSSRKKISSRKVTVESSKESDESSKRPSVFERLGPSSTQPTERHGRSKGEEKCLIFFRTGQCTYGNSCRYKHELGPTARRNKPEKESSDSKDLHKIKIKSEHKRESRTDSASPKRKSSKHRSSSRSRKGDHESKIKSAVVVTRPRSPSGPVADVPEGKKKADGPFEDGDDLDDWPIDAACLDYKGELTLERKRQQLQRELELEMQKEMMQMDAANVTITKTVAFSGSSSSSSSSDSGSISSSSESSTSSSGEESESSSSTSSSSSASRRAVVKKNKKAPGRDSSKPSKPKDPSYDKAARKSRSEKSKKHRSASPDASRSKSGRRKSRDKRRVSPTTVSPKKRHQDKGTKHKGPRTPSPPPVQSRKQRQWTQGSSADSRAADSQKRGKRHKKKKDTPRGEKRKGDHPPALSSPNRIAVLPSAGSKKSKSREDSSGRGRHRHRDPSPNQQSRTASASQSTKAGGSRHAQDDRGLKSASGHSRKDDGKRADSRDRKRQKQVSPPRRDARRDTPSPHRDRYDADRGKTDAPSSRRRSPLSPKQTQLPERRRGDTKRDVAPPPSTAASYRGSDGKAKRYSSPDVKKEKHGKEVDSWQADPRKTSDRRSSEPRARQDIRSQSSRSDRSRERDQDRKKTRDLPASKKRELTSRSIEESERTRIISPRRTPSPVHSHHGPREIESLTSTRRHYSPHADLPASSDYPYPPYDPYPLDSRADYENETLPSSNAPPYGGSDSGGYRRREHYDEPRRDVISLAGGRDEYLGDMPPLDDRSYDDRWQRNRSGGVRDDWDSYGSLPPEPLPPHVAATLDEDRDRYGMPRRRRASPPEWQRNRMDERDATRPLNRGSGPPREGRSKSPPKGGRGTWTERGGRHDSRGDSARQHEENKSSDDRSKSRTVRKDTKKKEEPEEKPKTSTKRPRSPSPALPAATANKAKKRRTGTSGDIGAFDLLKYHGIDEKSVKRNNNKDATKEETKATNKSQKTKQDDSSPKTSTSSSKDKSETGSKHSSEGRSKDEKKSRKNGDGSRKSEEFSDWSDDDLLTKINSNVFVECDTSDSHKSRHRSGEDGATRRKDKHRGKGHRTDSRERSVDEAKDGKKDDSKELDQETFELKEDTATDVDDYVTAESVDYDPISDDELDALIEEPDDSIVSQSAEQDKSKIVDALDVDWSALMTETEKPEFKAGLARRRFKTCHVLNRIGFSQALAGPELTQQIGEACKQQMDEEKEGDVTPDPPIKFDPEHPIAAFHVTISQAKQERRRLFQTVGAYRRALSARRDLHIRKILCKPIHKLTSVSAISYTSQFSGINSDLYKQSLELLRLKKPVAPPTPIGVC